jgi:hypothetical protein
LHDVYHFTIGQWLEYSGDGDEAYFEWYRSIINRKLDRLIRFGNHRDCRDNSFDDWFRSREREY